MIDDLGQNISDNVPGTEANADEQLGFEVLASKLRNYGKDNFPELNFNPITHIDVIREGAALHSLNLPKIYSEQLITLESAKYYLFSDAPVIFRLEEAFPSLKKSKVSVSENYTDIKKFYTKWSIEKSPKEMEFFALSTINLFDRNSNKENFLKYLFPACIYIYDKKFFSVAKAVELLATAEKICQASALSEELKVEFSYLISLYKQWKFCSFLHLCYCHAYPRR
ncbi:MAG: hypothetical protein HYV28_05000 [Ignavibacteriales bacterium]|nr:hypothetical protein [Ignavibacteriales bacterium]